MPITRIDWRKTGLCLGAVCAAAIGSVLYYGSTEAAETAFEADVAALEHDGAILLEHLGAAPMLSGTVGSPSHAECSCPSASEVASLRSELERAHAALHEAQARIQQDLNAQLSSPPSSPPDHQTQPHGHGEHHGSAKPIIPGAPWAREHHTPWAHHTKAHRNDEPAAHHNAADPVVLRSAPATTDVHGHGDKPHDHSHAHSNQRRENNADLFSVEGREAPVLVVEKTHDTDWSKSDGAHQILKFKDKDGTTLPRAAVWASISGLLAAVHQFAVSHGLTYWITHGSLLGALRDGHIIPWDNDCDIAMIEADVERFDEALRSGGDFTGHPGIVAVRFVHKLHPWKSTLNLHFQSVQPCVAMHPFCSNLLSVHPNAAALVRTRTALR